jgi:hypothetical protein
MKRFPSVFLDHLYLTTRSFDDPNESLPANQLLHHIGHQGTDSLRAHQAHMYTDKNRTGDMGLHLNILDDSLFCRKLGTL